MSTTGTGTPLTVSTMTSTDSAPLRPTRQRLAVAKVMASFDDFRSAQEIHDLLGSRGEAVGLATVYRTLQRMADAGEVDVLRTESGEAAYRRCSDSHHHHLVCRECGATVEVEGPAVEAWTRSIADRARLRRRQPHPRDLRHLPFLQLRLPGRSAPNGGSRCDTSTRHIAHFGGYRGSAPP